MANIPVLNADKDAQGGSENYRNSTDTAHNFLVSHRWVLKEIRHGQAPTSGSQQAFERNVGIKSMLGKAAMPAKLPTALRTF